MDFGILPVDEGEDTSLDGLQPTDDNFTKLRAYSKRLEKAVKAEQKKSSDLETKVTELEGTVRSGEVRTAAKTKGLSDEQVEALLALNPNASVEQVEALTKVFTPTPAQPAEGEEEASEAPVEPAAAQVPQGIQPQSGSHVPPTPKTTEDIAKLVREGDLAAVERIVLEATKNPGSLQLKHGALIE